MEFAQSKNLKDKVWWQCTTVRLQFCTWVISYNKLNCVSNLLLDSTPPNHSSLATFQSNRSKLWNIGIILPRAVFLWKFFLHESGKCFLSWSDFVFLENSFEKSFLLEAIKVILVWITRTNSGLLLFIYSI